MNMPNPHRQHPSLTAFSSLLWDIYINDPLTAYSDQTFSERNIIADLDFFQEIKGQLNWSKAECESIGSSPTNAAIAFAALGGKVQVAGPRNDGQLAEEIGDYLDRYDITQIYTRPAAVSGGQCICFQGADQERQFLVLYPIFDVETVHLPEIDWHATDWLLTSTYEFTTPQLAAWAP